MGQLSGDFDFTLPGEGYTLPPGGYRLNAYGPDASGGTGSAAPLFAVTPFPTTKESDVATFIAKADRMVKYPDGRVVFLLPGASLPKGDE